MTTIAPYDSLPNHDSSQFWCGMGLIGSGTRHDAGRVALMARRVRESAEAA